MLDFSDKPYQFFPPNRNLLVTRIAKELNRRFVLPGKNHRIKELELRHADRVLPVFESGSSYLLLPNHSTHSDPQLMFEVQRRLRINVSTMAAYDVFLRGRFGAWLMQSIGCFSVDREGSDKQAMNCAIDLLARKHGGLTVFPEGNVLLMNDRVAPFLGGAAFIGMRAQKKVGAGNPIFSVPVSLKFTHLEDCRDVIADHLAKLEEKLGIPAAGDLTMRQRMRLIGVQILSRNLRQRGYLPPADSDDDLSRLLIESATQILSKLEEKIELERKQDEPPMDRVRRIRAAIHQIRIDENQKLDHRVASTWADEAILAMRILSYSSNYLSDAPTLDRHSETLEKLREDLAEEILPPIGPRKAIVQFGEPIELTPYLEVKSRKALPELTRKFEQAVQSGIDEINARNELPGATVFE